MGAGHRVAIMSLREGSLLRSATAAGVPVHVLGASRALRLEKTLALAGVYRDMDQTDKARATYQKAIGLKAVEFNDAKYQEQARKELGELK